MLLLIYYIFYSGKNLFSVEENYFQIRCISFISLRQEQFPIVSRVFLLVSLLQGLLGLLRAGGLTPVVLCLLHSKACADLRLVFSTHPSCFCTSPPTVVDFIFQKLGQTLQGHLSICYL